MAAKQKQNFINITLIRTLNCTLLTPHLLVKRYGDDSLSGCGWMWDVGFCKGGENIF